VRRDDDLATIAPVCRPRREARDPLARRVERRDLEHGREPRPAAVLDTATQALSAFNLDFDGDAVSSVSVRPRHTGP
jgi:hypothetical protein